jgi:di/tricarboxylate transporter
LTQLFEHTTELSHYIYVVAFFLIVLGLLWGRFKAMHVFAAVVMALILSGFMGIKHIYATAVNPSILTVMALIALTGVLKKTLPFHRIGDLLGKSSKGFMVRTGLVTAALSGFINNTPVVALLDSHFKVKSKSAQLAHRELPHAAFLRRRRWGYHHTHWYFHQPRPQRTDD